MRVRAFFLVVLSAVVARGQSASDSNVKIVYFQRDNHAEVRTLDGRVLQSAAADTDKHLEVRVPQIVGITIADPNPLFFKYKKGDTTFVTNADYAAALAFAKAIEPASHLEIAMEGGIDPIEQVKKLAAQMPSIAQQTLLGDNNVRQAQATVSTWNLEAIEAALGNGTGSSDGGVADVETVGEKKKGGDLSPGVVANDFNTGQQSSNNQQKTQTTQPAPKTPQEQQIADLTAEVGKLRQEIEAGKAAKQQNAELEEAKKTLATLFAFRKSVNDVNQEISFAPETIDLEKDPTIHLLIDRLPQFPSVDTAPRKTGDVAIPLRAYSPVHLAFGPAMVYSFVKAPSFTTEPKDGKFTIVEKPGKNRAQNISAMLNITPRSWSDATFGGSFQLGVSPVKDQMGLFGGVQVRISRLATIGGGYGFQQVPRLDRSQTPGGTLDKADDLKTTNHYKGGAYVAITLSLPKEAEK